jgi:putative transposase
MPRQARHASGDVVHHVLNRAAGKMELFRHDADFAAFQRVLVETLEQIPIRVCGYCLMPTHWHLVLWPRKDGELSRFMQRLTITHVRRWLEHRHRVGLGSVYQGRYKSFPVQDDAHLSTLMRYVHRNPLKAGLVKRAEEWKWSSLFAGPTPDAPPVPICSWPIARRNDWVQWVNRPQTAQEELLLKRSLDHTCPFGSDHWTARMEKAMDLPPLRRRGRPPKTARPA